MRITDRFNLVHSAARTATGNNITNPIDISQYNTAIAWIKISALSGTSPTIAVAINALDPDGGAPYQLAVTGALNSVSVTGLPIAQLYGKRIYASWVIAGGTPSITFKIDVEVKD